MPKAAGGLGQQGQRASSLLVGEKFLPVCGLKYLFQLGPGLVYMAGSGGAKGSVDGLSARLLWLTAVTKMQAYVDNARECKEESNKYHHGKPNIF